MSSSDQFDDGNSPPFTHPTDDVSIAQRRLLEAMTTLARKDQLLEIVAAAGVVREQWDVAGDPATAAVWHAISGLALAIHVDYRRSTEGGTDGGA